MRNDSPEIDPQRIWQGQPAGSSQVTLEKIRLKMRELHAKTRKQMLGTLVAPLAAVFFYIFEAKEFPFLRDVLQPLSILALIWSFAGLFFLNRGMWPLELPPDAGLTTGLDFCRREIERRRLLLRRVLFWSFGPVLLCLATVILALVLAGTKDRSIFPNGLPFLALVAAWIVGYFVVRLREQRELQREIDELNQIGRENDR